MQHNHEVSSEMAPFYAINRRIKNSELQEVAGAVEMIPNSRSLQHFLQIHFQRPTTLQDAKNVRARLKALKSPPAAAVTRLHADAEQEFSPHGKVEEDEEENDTMLESTEEDADDFEEEEVEGVESRENYLGRKTDRHKTLIQQEGEEEQEQAPELDPSIRKEVVNRIKARLHRTLENCDSLVFMERMSVIESLVEGWENGNTDYSQDTEESGVKGRLGGLENLPVGNTHLIQGRTDDTQSERLVNSQPDIDNLNTTIPNLGMRPQFHPRQTNVRVSDMNHKNNSAFTDVEMNGRENIAELTPSNGNSCKQSRTDQHMSKRCENNERRPVILSIAKGLVEGCEQAVEVEIEVDGELAKVRAVKREPLDYHEVYVGDYW